MKSRPATRIGAKLAWLLLTIMLFAVQDVSGGPPGAAWQEAEARVSADGRFLEVPVPEGATKVLVEVMNARGKWIRRAVRRVPEGRALMRFKPARRALARPWRAWAEVPGSVKFPTAFYKGRKNFGKVPSEGYGEALRVSRDVPMGVVATSGDRLPTDSGAEVETTTEEADIWKSDGTTVYFFNQLRGLQVIDLSDPADPVLVGSLRLPAVGQDLYPLPHVGDARHLLLLAQDPSIPEATVVHLATVRGDLVEWVASKQFSGVLADSRLRGNRLFLATQARVGRVGPATDQVVLREIVIDVANGAIAETASQEITGSQPVLSAGDDWMAVALVDWNDPQASEVTLFSLAGSGLRRWNEVPIRTAGRVADKFKMRVRDGVFSVFSEGWRDADWGTSRRLVTTLENFSVGGEALATLEIIEDERLFETRFAGDAAYAVTFEEVDPLWVIDLSDPAAPAITGHLEVPGWSTHIEPIGDMLFSIGLDGGRVAASLFDVSDPGNPTLASRVFLSDFPVGFSEAVYNEKALTILEEQKLVLIPFTLPWLIAGGPSHRIELLEIDQDAKVLVRRGHIAHDFQPRRAAMVGSALASISQRQLVTADLSDPDQPAILADLLLAWPVQHVVATGGYLLQMSDGSERWDAGPALRVSTMAEPDLILAEIPLDVPSVRDVVPRGDKLFILHTGVAGGANPTPRAVEPILRIPDLSGAIGLLVFDIADPLAPELIHTASVALGNTFAGWETGSLLFPSETTAVVLAQQKEYYPWPVMPMPIVIDDIAVAATSTIDRAVPDLPYGRSLATVFDLAGDSHMAFGLGHDNTLALEGSLAADGLVVFGMGERLAERFQPWGRRAHHAGILDVSDPENPTLLDPIALPGRLVAVSELDRRGFLAWTESGQGKGILVSACDFQDAYLVSGIPRSKGRAIAVDGRAAFVADRNGVVAYELQDNRVFRPRETANLGWVPDSLRVLDGSLCASAHHRLASMPVDSFAQEIQQWEAVTEFELEALAPLAPDRWVAPAGDLGVELFD
jgi:hypothetical protein